MINKCPWYAQAFCTDLLQSRLLQWLLIRHDEYINKLTYIGSVPEYPSPALNCGPVSGGSLFFFCRKPSRKDSFSQQPCAHRIYWASQLVVLPGGFLCCFDLGDIWDKSMCAQSLGEFTMEKESTGIGYSEWFNPQPLITGINKLLYTQLILPNPSFAVIKP